MFTDTRKNLKKSKYNCAVGCGLLWTYFNVVRLCFLVSLFYTIKEFLIPLVQLDMHGWPFYLNVASLGTGTMILNFVELIV